MKCFNFLEFYVKPIQKSCKTWFYDFSVKNTSIKLYYLITVWKLRDFTATFFSQKFRESNFLQKNFTLNWFDEKNLHGREFLVFPHCVAVMLKFQNYNLTRFWKKISFRERNVHNVSKWIHSEEKSSKTRSLSLRKTIIFRQINVLLKKLPELISRKFFHIE